MAASISSLALFIVFLLQHRVSVIAGLVDIGREQVLGGIGPESDHQHFSLRHIFYHDLKDVENSPVAFTDVVSLQRMSNIDTVEALTRTTSLKSRKHTTKDITSSSENVTPVPDVTDKDTIVNLASMTSDAYVFNSSDTGWLNLTQGYHDTLPFGYKSNGLRGHVFTNHDNSTIIVSFKGTSIDPREDSPTKDRLNDNLLFSCCCATQRPDPYWYGPVCSCRSDVYQCNSTCLTTELRQEDHYYAAATAVINNITQDIFPNATVWAIGHSLGGSLASLMGLTFDLPVVTFEAPPDRLAAERLGLYQRHHHHHHHNHTNSTSASPFKPAFQTQPKFPAHHIGNTADPVYMGACNGITSLCAVAGFSFESQCFTGKRCVYDTVDDKGWHVSVANHRINTVIESVLKIYDDVPVCEDESDQCVDCFNWRYT